MVPPEVATASDRDRDSSLRDFAATEYHEALADFRHRDNMLWQSLGAAIAVNGATALLVSVKEANIISILIASLNILLTFVCFLKAVKDNYYQNGSLQYASCISEFLMGEPDSEWLQRIYLDSPLPGMKGGPRFIFPPELPLHNHLYIRMANISTFYFYFITLLFLQILSIVVFVYTIYKIMCA